MNIYGVLLLLLGVGMFIYATDMAEPFGFLGEQLEDILLHIRSNNVLFNAVVLALVVALFTGVIRKLFAKKEKSLEEQILERIQREQQEGLHQGHPHNHNRR